MKQLASNAESGAAQVLEAGWDFSESDTEPSTAPNSPEGTDDGTVRTISDKRCSRFVVEAESKSNTDVKSTKSSPLEEKAGGNQLENDDINEGEEIGGVRKGRFSVLESAVAERDNSSPPIPSDVSQIQTPVVGSLVEGEIEDGRRSRFKVEINTAPPPSAAPDSLEHSVAANGTQSRFHVSQPQGNFSRVPIHESVDSLPAPFPRGPTYPLYEEVGANGGAPTHNVQFGRDYSHPQSALIFVHPSQFDQLLLLNELIRQQLIELRNSTRRNNESFYGSSASYHPTIHNTGYPEWEGTRPMVEDPQVSYPPHISSYSPACDLPWPNIPDSRNFKRRSMSIDQRGNPSGLSRTVASAGTHRTVHSLKSPIQPDGVETMRRELEMLRRENELLRKRT